MEIIIKVRYYDGEISEVMLENGIKETKVEVIRWIGRGVDYKTSDGAKVHVVDGKYIRTDGNNKEEDNLGSLPTF